MAARVCAVVVAYQCRDDVCALVASLLAQEGDQPRVLVVDNASTDGTAEALAGRFPAVEVLRLARNTGGAGGFAAGMRHALRGGHEFLWLLDGDALATPDALRELLAVAERDPRIGAAGSQIAMRDHPDLVQEIGGHVEPWTGRLRFVGAFEAVDPDRPSRDVDFVPACSLLARAEAVREVGTFRDELFIFYDDIDWCDRLRRAGWRVVTAPRSLVHHRFHGGKPLAPWRVYYGVRNQLAYHWRNRRGPRRWVETGVWYLHARLRASRWRRRQQHQLAAAAISACEDFLAARSGPRHGAAPPPGDLVDAQVPERDVVLVGGHDLAADLRFLAWWARRGSGRAALEAPPRSTLLLERLGAGSGTTLLTVAPRGSPRVAAASAIAVRARPSVDLLFTGDGLMPYGRDRQIIEAVALCAAGLATLLRLLPALPSLVRRSARRPPGRAAAGEGRPARSGTYDLALLAPTWSDTLERFLIRHRHRSILLACGDHLAGLPLPSVETARLRIQAPPAERMRWIAGRRADDAILFVPMRESWEYGSYELAFRRLRARRRWRWDRGRARASGRWELAFVLVMKAFLRTCQALQVSIRVCPWPWVVAMALLRLMRHPVRAARPATLRRDMRHARDQLVAWRWGGGLSLGLLRQHVRMIQSFVAAFVRDHGRQWERPPPDPRRILVVQPDLIGDSVISMTLIEALHRRHGGARIEVVVAPKTAPLFARLDYLHRIHVLQDRNPRQHEAAAEGRPWQDLRRTLRATSFDALIVASLWPERAIMANDLDVPFTSAAACPEALYYKAQLDGRRPAWMHDIALWLGRDLDVEPVVRPVHHLAGLRRQRTDRTRIRIGVQTFAPFPPRRLPAAWFHQVLLAVARRHLVEFVVFDKPNLFWRLAHPLPGARFAGHLPLMEAIELLGTCDLLVANEGGLGHVADAMGIPTVLVYTSTSPEVWRAPGPTVPLYEQVACSPCHMRFCPRDYECHSAFPLDRFERAVAEAVGRISGSRDGRPAPDRMARNAR